MTTALRFIAATLVLASEAMGLYLMFWSTNTEIAPAFVVFLVVSVPVLGFYAGVELWKLNEKGRRAGVLFCLLSAAVILLHERSTVIPLARLVLAGVAAAIGVVLMSPAARRVCAAMPGSATARI